MSNFDITVDTSGFNMGEIAQLQAHVRAVEKAAEERLRAERHEVYAWEAKVARVRDAEAKEQADNV